MIEPPDRPTIDVVPIVHAVLGAMLTLAGALVGAMLARIDGVGTIATWGVVVIVLPLIGIVLLGIHDWQVGRGATILRAGDVAALIFGGLLVRGDGGTWWLGLGTVAAAAAGLIASATSEVPQRDGWRL